ncbi:hypothetical protein J8281_13705 [Aquimarina sp. U1-2]|uniref:hypothetical protein n=1 Tax=Aquimarina sp. U1-2 TaxID=2823141 RepID=UPI001AECF5B5|nr:hypothetical protein [Aquimarina sp. U1-2]MBP2833244.1 hypothetical protein [Aquimarina sp. U1-2]
MNYFIYLLIAIATTLMIYNATHLDLDNILAKDSKTALIGMFASACAIILMCILLVSRKIQQKKKNT